MKSSERKYNLFGKKQRYKNKEILLLNSQVKINVDVRLKLIKWELDSFKNSIKLLNNPNL